MVYLDQTGICPTSRSLNVACIREKQPKKGSLQRPVHYYIYATEASYYCRRFSAASWALLLWVSDDWPSLLY